MLRLSLKITTLFIKHPTKSGEVLSAWYTYKQESYPRMRCQKLLGNVWFFGGDRDLEVFKYSIIVIDAAFPPKPYFDKC